MKIDWTPLREILEVSQRFVLTTHVRPDADAIGSEVALAGLLEQLGKEVRIINASVVPPRLEFLDPEKKCLQLGTQVSEAEACDADVHIILDNLSAHKAPTVQRWLLRHRRFRLHFTPTYGSWMNLVERWFSALTTKKLQRSAHRNVKELAADILAWADTWNENPRPFVWTKTAEQILERLAGYCATINTIA